MEWRDTGARERERERENNLSIITVRFFNTSCMRVKGADNKSYSVIFLMRPLTGHFMARIEKWWQVWLVILYGLIIISQIWAALHGSFPFYNYFLLLLAGYVWNPSETLHFLRLLKLNIRSATSKSVKWTMKNLYELEIQ